MPDNPADPSSYMDPNPTQLAGPGMDANNALVAQQAAAQAAIKKLLLQRIMQQQGGFQAPSPAPMMGMPPARPAPQMMPGQVPFGGIRG